MISSMSSGCPGRSSLEASTKEPDGFGRNGGVPFLGAPRESLIEVVRHASDVKGGREPMLVDVQPLPLAKVLARSPLT